MFKLKTKVLLLLLLFTVPLSLQFVNIPALWEIQGVALASQRVCTQTGGTWYVVSTGPEPTYACSCPVGEAYDDVIGCHIPATNPGNTTNPGSSSNPENTDFRPSNSANFETNNREINENEIFIRLHKIINVLSIGVGIVITISVVFAGIQYITSRGDPQQTAKAVHRLWQAGIAIFLYVFGWTILNWLIPGGVLNSNQSSSSGGTSTMRDVKDMGLQHYV